jgi:hypothetical protein
MLSMGRAIRRTLGVGVMAGMIGCLHLNAFMTAGQKSLDPSKAMIEALPASGGSIESDK